MEVGGWRRKGITNEKRSTVYWFRTQYQGLILSREGFAFFSGTMAEAMGDLRGVHGGRQGLYTLGSFEFGINEG